MAILDAGAYMCRLVAALEDCFGGRLLYAGLQGSYRRGEATDASDIDPVVILDRVALGDLKVYRALLEKLPAPDKACGFVAGADELRHWPTHELFQFALDTDDYFGRLAPLLPPMADDDATRGLRVGAAALYHEVVHAYVHAKGDALATRLAGACKQAGFLVALASYLRSGVYSRSRRELMDKVEPEERAWLVATLPGADAAAAIGADPEQYAAALLAWSRARLTGEKI